MNLLMLKQASSKTSYLNSVLFILLAFVWSGSFINIKITVDNLPPIFSALMRVVTSMFFLAILFKTTGKKVFIPNKKFGVMWLTGLFTQAIPFALLFYGEKFIAPALASIINSTVSLWALLLGTLIFRDLSQWTPVKVLGLLLGFFGIIYIFYPMMQGSENRLIGVVSVTGMAIAYAIGGLMNQHLIFKNKEITFEMNLFQQHVSSLLFLIATSLSLETWPSFSFLFDLKILGAIIYLGLIATAIGWLIYFYLIREWGAVRASSVMYIVPVLAIFWDLVFLHITPTHAEILGTVAILIGVTLIQWVRKPKPISEV